MVRKKKKEIMPMLEEMGVDLDELTQEIIKILERQKLVSENRLATRLKLKINAARKLLYRLQSRGLITYVKKRDEKKKWWYLYFWSLDFNRIHELYTLYLTKQLARKKAELTVESEFVFECNICSRKYNYEDALETEFACPQCGDLLIEVKDAKTTRKLKRDIESIESELAEAEEVGQKILEKAMKKAEKESALADAKAKRKAARLKKKELAKKKTQPKTKLKKTPAKKSKPAKKPEKKKPKRKKPKLSKSSVGPSRTNRSARKSLAKKVQAKQSTAAPKKKSLVKRVLRTVLLRKKRK